MGFMEKYSLKAESCHDAEFVVTDGTGSFRSISEDKVRYDDNFQYQGHGITLYALFTLR